MIEINTKDFSTIWQKNELVQKAREIILPKIEGGRYDTQDLEHQIIFRMTTYPLEEAFKQIDNIIEEQKYIVEERIKASKVPPEKLFVFGFNRSEDNRGILKWEKEKDILYSCNGEEKEEIIFKEITSKKEKLICKDIIENYHYIHCDRCHEQKGLIFGFFVKGNSIPFAIEEVEPCSLSRNYKKAILLLSNVNYHTTVELTRFYSVPNTPRNLIGIMDKLVGRELRDKGYEWLMTAVMPAFAKTKSSTIAGGIDKPILSKHLEFNFFERNDGRFELCVDRKRDRVKTNKVIKSKWNLFPVVEMIKPLKKGLDLKIDKNKIYHVKKN